MLLVGDTFAKPDQLNRWKLIDALNPPASFRAMLPDRKNYLTDNYDADRMLGEIAVMNNVLFGIDGSNSRTYSVPCSQMRVGEIDYTDALRRSGLVKYARTGGDAYKSVITDYSRL